MDLKYFCLILLLSVLSSCVDKTDNHPRRQTNEFAADDEPEEEDYGDGEWCADVEYYNPNTGTRHTYTLDVEVEDGELVKIDWPNGGWLDESHFVAEDITSGECSFISDRGYHYTVTLSEKGGCGYSDANKLRRDIENEIRQTTCSKCGQEKDSYNNVCDDCRQKAETCQKCYGYKFSWESICDDCKRDLRRTAEDGEEIDY